MGGTDGCFESAERREEGIGNGGALGEKVRVEGLGQGCSFEPNAVPCRGVLRVQQCAGSRSAGPAGLGASPSLPEGTQRFGLCQIPSQQVPFLELRMV